MKTFKNTSPNALMFTLSDGSEHILGVGDTAELPETDGFIASLVAQGYLSEQAQDLPTSKSPK